jgi:hypoxanthine phosphoribosyltransferase
MSATGSPGDCDWLSLTSFSTAGNGERVRINRKPRLALAGRDVILVAGMISSGLEAAFTVRWLERQGVRSVGLCALLNREDARILELPPALVGFDVGSDPLAGFGIAYQERFADLPHVAVLRSAAKSKPRLLQTT